LLFQFLNHRTNSLLPSTDAKGITRKHSTSLPRRQTTYGRISFPAANILKIKQIMQAINGVTLICIFSKRIKEKKKPEVKRH
jgi:hypothetical protein